MVIRIGYFILAMLILLIIGAVAYRVTPNKERVMVRVTILAFISIVLGIPAYFIGAVASALQADYAPQAYPIIAIGSSGAFITLIGGLVHILSVEPIKWWSVLIASLGAIVCFPVTGIPALIIVLKGRENRL